MKLFSWKSAGRDNLRPVLSSVGGPRVIGDWPVSYEAQVREAYLGNAVAQRAVRVVADGIGEAPLSVSSPAGAAGAVRGQALLATVAAQLLLLLLHDNAASVIDLPPASIGTTIKVIASGLSDVAGPALADAVVPGRSVLPPAPVDLAATPLPGGDVGIGSIRRSRAGWRWIDGADAPLGEECEGYRSRLSRSAARRGRSRRQSSR